MQGQTLQLSGRGAAQAQLSCPWVGPDMAFLSGLMANPKPGLLAMLMLMTVIHPLSSHDAAIAVIKVPLRNLADGRICVDFLDPSNELDWRKDGLAGSHLQQDWVLRGQDGRPAYWTGVWHGIEDDRYAEEKHNG